MTPSDIEVAIIGGGAAGIAAARRLHDAGVPCLIVEARSRLGGRAWTITDRSGCALDLGCGWLHSADRNPWHGIAEQQGRTIDRTPPPWTRVSPPIGFPLAEQRAFLDALQTFYQRLGAAPEDTSDRPASDLLERDGRWNNLINAVSTYISGAELDRISLIDFGCYEDTGVNWRVVEGYGAVIAAYGTNLPVVFDCPVHRIDHSGKRLRIETAKGAIAADRVIVTLPSALLARGAIDFTPALPDKQEAAAGLPLGLADKLFLALERADEFENETRLFGRTDRSATAFYHMRPFGRPMIEAYFGGALAGDLERSHQGAFFDFAKSELAGVLGSDFVRRVAPIGLHRWGSDPLAGGSYSYARPGAASCRATLASAVGDRLFFAGEACSATDFSTAHGALLTGQSAAEQAIAARPRSSR
jgi:monoamine oxidase